MGSKGRECPPMWAGRGRMGRKDVLLDRALFAMTFISQPFTTINLERVTERPLASFPAPVTSPFLMAIPNSMDERIVRMRAF